MSNQRCKFLEGFTLIEVMVAIIVLVIIALGALNYQYYAALHARAALAQMTATRTAQLLADDWKSAGGSAAYNPTNLNLGFTDSDLDGVDYEITVDNLPMFVSLSYNDIEHDDQAQITLRKITVQVNWRNDRRVPTGQAEEEASMELSTYVRVDASGG
jgi:prepilin-type N-terminal cleavage/methylation domain-containing protein